MGSAKAAVFPEPVFADVPSAAAHVPASLPQMPAPAADVPATAVEVLEFVVEPPASLTLEVPESAAEVPASLPELTSPAQEIFAAAAFDVGSPEPTVPSEHEVPAYEWTAAHLTPHEVVDDRTGEPVGVAPHEAVETAPHETAAHESSVAPPENLPDFVAAR